MVFGTLIASGAYSYAAMGPGGTFGYAEVVVSSSFVCKTIPAFIVTTMVQGLALHCSNFLLIFLLFWRR